MTENKINNILLYNPAISTLNMGDYIIFDGVLSQLHDFLDSSFVIEATTRQPIPWVINRKINFDYKVVCGTNLLRGKLNRHFRPWDISVFNAKEAEGSILMGVGWWQYGDEINHYTKKLYRRVLSDKYTHSVRDEYTKKQLNKIGIYNVLNTGCPTMWGLDESHCKLIPEKKAEDVVFTITDYRMDKDKDSQLIKILSEQYNNVYLWLQGSNDYNYLQTLDIDADRIKLISSSLKAYDKILDTNIDYVGTRLHAGIRAMQKKKRAIILGVDNRAIEKKKDFNINCLNRDDLNKLPEYINSNIPTRINLPMENIRLWKSQFTKDGSQI